MMAMVTSRESLSETHTHIHIYRIDAITRTYMLLLLPSHPKERSYEHTTGVLLPAYG